MLFISLVLFVSAPFCEIHFFLVFVAHIPIITWVEAVSSSICITIVSILEWLYVVADFIVLFLVHVNYYLLDIL